MTRKLVYLTQEEKEWVQFADRAANSRLMYYGTKPKLRGLVEQSTTVIFSQGTWSRIDN